MSGASPLGSRRGGDGPLHRPLPRRRAISIAGSPLGATARRPAPERRCTVGAQPDDARARPFGRCSARASAALCCSRAVSSGPAADRSGRAICSSPRRARPSDQFGLRPSPPYWRVTSPSCSSALLLSSTRTPARSTRGERRPAGRGRGSPAPPPVDRGPARLGVLPLQPLAAHAGSDAVCRRWTHRPPARPTRAGAVRRSRPARTPTAPRLAGRPGHAITGTTLHAGSGSDRRSLRLRAAGPPGRTRCGPATPSGPIAEHQVTWPVSGDRRMMPRSSSPGGPSSTPTVTAWSTPVIPTSSTPDRSSASRP